METQIVCFDIWTWNPSMSFSLLVNVKIMYVKKKEKEVEEEQEEWKHVKKGIVYEKHISSYFFYFFL